MKLKLWTIQSMGAWDILQSQGYLTGKLSEMPPEWKEEYEWMMEKMKNSIGMPEEDDQYPENIKHQIEKSWSKVFDLNYEAPFPPYNKQDKRIQATFWQLNSAEIIKVDTFTAR